MNRLDRIMAAVALGSLAAVCLIPAWFFGGRLPELRIAIAAVVAVGAGASLVRAALKREDAPAIPGLAVLVLLGAMLGAGQLVPLNALIGRRLAPEAWTLRSELTPVDSQVSSPGRASPVESASQDSATRWPLSFYPAWTRRTVWMLFVCAGLVVLSADLLGRPREARWFLMAVGLNGAALAVFGLAQQFAWTGKIYGLVPLPPDGGSPFGPFMNRNNAGGFLNLCLAGAVGAAWLSWRTRQPDTKDVGPDHFARRPRRRRDRMFEVLAQLDGAKLLFPVAAVFIAAAIGSSLSRGATLAMLFALATLAAISFGRRLPGRTILLFSVASLAVLLLAWLGRIDPINERMQTLADLEKAGAGRLDNWSDALKLVPDFWLTGTGLGTYRFVYMLHEQRACNVWFYHAENQFVETLVELGVVGFTLLVAAIVIVGMAAVRLLRLECEWAAVGLAGVMMLVSQIVAGSFDFGLYAPANMALMATFCGVVVGAARRSRRAEASGSVVPSPAMRWLAAAVLAACVVGAVGGAYEFRARRALKNVERSLRDDAEQGDVEVSREEMARVRHWLDEAIRISPDDAEAHWKMAEWHIHEFRRAATDRLLQARPELPDRAAAWALTTLLQLHSLARNLERLGDTQALQNLRTNPEVQEHLVPAVQHLKRARVACPLLARVHLLLAELDVIVGDGKSESLCLQRAVRVEPSRSNLAYLAGVIAWQSGNVEGGCRFWRHCLKLSPEFDRQIVAAIQTNPRVAQSLDRLLPDDASVLFRLAHDQFRGEAFASLRSRLYRRVLDLLSESNSLAGSDHFMAAVASQELGEVMAAETHFQAATAAEPANEAYRRAYADFLRSQRRWDEAIRQYQLCRSISQTPERYDHLLQAVRRQRNRPSR